MKCTMLDVIEMIERNESPDEYETRIRKLKRYSNELIELKDSIEVLEEFGNCEEDFKRLDKKIKRLNKVKKIINDLKS